MITECRVAVQSFLLGLGNISYFVLPCVHIDVGTLVSLTYLNWIDNWCLYSTSFFIGVLLLICVIYRVDFEWQVAIRAYIIGTAFGWGIAVKTLYPDYSCFGWYIIILSTFHFSEYVVTGLSNPNNLSTDSFLLNHSIAYGVAAVSSWVEFFVEYAVFPTMKKVWLISYLGMSLCVIGEVTRKLAMLTAKKNFNHVIQVQKETDHELVTSGIYGVCRHPSYVGWFWWSIGTQVVLLNPVCFIVYLISSWSFFNSRIYYEELYLIKFFGAKYIEYKNTVGSGLPFIRGFAVKK